LFDFLDLQAKLYRTSMRASFSLVAVAAICLTCIAPAQAHGVRPGVRSAAPSRASLSGALQQNTGLTPSQVTSHDICPAVGPGYARCAGQALVLRSSHALVRPHARRHATLGRVKPGLVPGFVQPATAPALTAPSPGTPAYLQQAYDLSYLSQNRGAGDTIAIVDAYDDSTAESDLATYRSTFGLPACTTANGCFRKVNQSGNSSPLPVANAHWQEEESLDLDAVSALCPNCHILLVEANSDALSDLYLALHKAATMGVNQISNSWTGASTSPFPGTTWTFPGIATVAATGDAGYTGAPNSAGDNYPAAFPGVTAAGGTSLASATGGNARGFSEGAWSLSGTSGGGSGCDLKVKKPSYQTDSGCSQNVSGQTFGRSYADVSADADPGTGLNIYNNRGWELIGGTSLSTPLIAAYYALTGVTTSDAQWAYTHSAMLNDPTTGSTGTCATSIRYICNAGLGYDGPTGVGSISGAVVTGAPGIGGAANGSGSNPTYTQSTRSRGATIEGGIYPNGLDTSWWIEYGTDNNYGQQTPATDVGASTSPIQAAGYLSHLSPDTSYHYRLVAQNSLGTTYGYDYTFTTPDASPADPTASFSAPIVATPSSSVAFDATGSDDSGDTITGYSWDFGDGNGVSLPVPTASASHTYSSPGVYVVTLIVTSSDGHSDSTSETITIDQPLAAFRTPPTITAPGAPANFDASGSTDAEGTIANYHWNFGDGSTTDTPTPAVTHTYALRNHYTLTLTITNNNGQTSTIQHTIAVDTAPTAAFSPPTDIQQAGVPANFDAGASTAMPGGSIADYKWDFGDGSLIDDTHAIATASHSYASAGVYTVALTVTDDLGITNATTQTVTVDQPAASFTVSADPIDPGSAAAFDASGSTDPKGSITDYSWDFGDDTTDSGETVSHTYADRGTYHVTLTITNDNGQQNSVEHDVTVDTAPTAAFTPSASVATPNSQLSFDTTGSSAMTGGFIKSYSWDFGDSTNDIGPDPSHSYANAGIYTVTLRVTDDLNITSTATQTITIDQPTARFASPQAIPAPGSAATFDATASTDPAGTVADYSWNFGDNTGTIEAGSSPSTPHTFTSRGTYHVTLTITNNSGQQDSVEHDVTVDTPPTAAFAPSATVATPNSQLSFDANASTAMAAGSIADYKWNFGDGSPVEDTGATATATHTYANPGVYTVLLTVTDDLGIPSTTTHAVTVDAAPTASFAGSPNPATTGPAASFDGSGSSDTLGTILSYRWDFGDGATGSGATAKHAYATPGHYTVTLTVTNDAGQQSGTSHSITVDAAPTALFSISPSATQTGAPVGFNGGSSNDAVGAITGYSWNFGDGATATGAGSSHTYANPGTYTVALTVTNDAGQSSTSSQAVTVYAAPSAGFSVAPAATLTGAPVSFNGSGSSDTGGAITAYSWNFGDGGSASGPSPSHAYSNPGTYTVTLTVTGSLGLASSTSHTVSVSPPPLSARLSAKRQKLPTVLKHGLSVSVSTNTAAKASFLVTVPVHVTKHSRRARERVSHTTNATLLRTGTFNFAPGSHTASLRLSRAAASKLRSGGNSVLTLQMTLTDIYGRKLVRSVKLTVGH
jgi:PKD repeat protein